MDLFAKLEFLYFEFVAVHVANGEIHVVLQDTSAVIPASSLLPPLRRRRLVVTLKSAIYISF